jgi:hypothetical protein
MMTTRTATQSLSKAADPALALCRHFQHCERSRGHWFGAAQLAERLHGLMAPRFATTVGMAAVLMLVFMSL